MLIQIGRLVLPLVLVVVVGAPYLLRAFGADYAAAGTPLLQLLAIATIPQALSELYLSLARVRQQLVGMLALRGTSFALVLGLSLAMLPGYGITGIGIAQAASQTIVALALLPRLRAMLRD